MGLRRWINRQAKRSGVQDPSRGAHAYPIDQRREWVLDTIDSSPFQIWVVVVAGMGFLTDAYGIFALNVVIPMLGFVYWPQSGQVPRPWKVAFLCATLVGTMIGNVTFGIAADFVGRRKMYGMALVVLILSTLLLAMSSRGEQDSMDVGGFIVTWRLITGLSIGADYPLAAVITSEFAPRKHRARMMASVFFMQPIGQLLANVVSIAVVAGWKGNLSQLDHQQDNYTCWNRNTANKACIVTIDRMWRLVVGLGTIPAVISLAFRFTIPESPRYKMDIKRKVNKAHDDTNDFFGQGYEDAEQPMVEINQKDAEVVDPIEVLPPSPQPIPSRDGLLPDQLTSRRHHRSPSSDIAPDQDGILRIEDDDTSHTYNDHTYMATRRASVPLEYRQPPMASKEDFRNFFWAEGNWTYLLGTSLSWFCLDFAYYGLGLSSPDIVSYIWYGQAEQLSVYRTLLNNSGLPLIMVSIGTTVGGAAMIKVIKHVSPKTLQFWGFIVLAVLFIVIGGAWKTLLKPSHSTGLIVLYVFCQLAFNLGPNVTTFIIPAEIFPTRYRCTCHGISAAAGKLGSWVAQLFIAYAFKGDLASGERGWFSEQSLGVILIIMSGFMIAGAVTTYFLIPETREHRHKSRSLELLAEGRLRLEELNKTNSRDD